MKRAYRTDTFTDVITTSNSDAIDLDNVKSLSIQCVVDVDVPAAVVVAAGSVDTTDDEFASTAHDYTTGLKVQVSTSNTIPTGLSLVTDYFVIVTDADNFKFATSLANAQAGTAVNITTQGVGNHTVTPQALAGASVVMQMSNENSPTNWSDISALTSITADGNVWFESIDPTGRWARASYSITSGRLSATNTVLIKKE